MGTIYSNSFKKLHRSECGPKPVNIKAIAGLIIFLFLPVQHILSQTSNYSLTPSAGTFTPIIGTPGSLSAGDEDEGYFNSIPIGFTFRFYNTDYTSVSASTNGWMTFGQAINNPSVANNLETGGIRPLVAPWWDDLSLTAISDFSYTTTGVAPDRVFTAQWLNVKWDWAALSGVISFQVKLYETTGRIEFVYSQLDGEVSNFSGGASIGIAGPSTGVYNFVSLQAADPSATASSTVDIRDIGNRPLTDQVFSFAPVTITATSPSQTSAGNIMPGTTNNILSAFQVTAVGANAVLKNLSFSTTGTCTASDILNLRLFYNSSSSFAGATALSTIGAYAGPGAYSFTGLNQDISGTGYFWITCDVSATATLGRNVNTGSNPSMSFTQGLATGTITAGGIQTISGAVVTISSPNPSTPAGNIQQSTLNNIIYRLDNNVILADATITGLTITTSGTYVASDISNFKVYYSTDATFSPATDTYLIKKSATGPGPQIFSLGGQVIPANSTGYLFITIDVPCAAIGGHTISVNPVSSSDVVFTSGTKSGSGYAGGVQTIQDLTPANVTAPSAVTDVTNAVLTWTAPAGCYDQVMIVAKAGSSITATPSGDGSAYTGSLVYGSGTTYDGGYVVFKGTAFPQTVTGLIAGNTYYFKFFTRKGTNWSNGVEVSTATAPPSNGEYRSAASGDWGAPSSWQTYNGTSWVTPTFQQGTPTNQSGKITIRNGHTVTVRANTTVDEVTVDAGGVINLINNRSLIIANGPDAVDLIVNGSIINLGTITATGSIAFNNGALYEHQQNDGSIPVATWNVGSTCLVTGTTNTVPTAGLNQAFYNFTWNCTGQKGLLSLNGNPANVSGTFRLSSTGSGQTAGSLTQGGNVTYNNFLVAGGTFNLTGGQSRTVNVTNFTIQGGTLNMSDAGTGIMNVAGNFTATGGTITETGTGSGNIVFNGTYNGSTGIQTYTSGVLVSNTVNFTVNPNAYLQMAAEGSIVGGGGTFTLSNGATLGVTSVNGISAAGTASGNIQATGRVFNAGANYIYNLIGGTQFSGSGLPVTAITGNVTIPVNVILTSTNNIIMNGTLTVNGTLLPGHEYDVFSGTGTLTGTGRVKVTRISATPDFLSQYTIANKVINNMLIDYYTSSGGQIISPVTYGNLTMSNTSGINTLGGTVNVNGTLSTTSGGTLSVGAGTFLTATNVNNNGILSVEGQGRSTISSLVNNGTLNLNSTSSSDIFSLMIDNYSGQGTANVGLFVTGGGSTDAWKWHYVAVPATINKSVFLAYDPYNLMAYDDSFVPNTLTASDNDGWLWHDGWDGSGFSRPVFNQLVVGKGYSHLQPSATATININNLTSLQTNLGTLGLQYSGTGKLVPANYGKNLLGNSLTCGIDWNLVTETGDVDDAIYYLIDYKLATFLRGAPAGINGGTNFIPPLQGFVVISNATGSSLNFSAARVHTSQPRYKKGTEMNEESKESGSSAPYVKLQIINTTLQDETLIWFNENATAGFDGGYDASKMFAPGSYDQIYTMNGAIRYAINGLTLPTDSILIPIALKLSTDGNTYQINASYLQNLDGYKIILKDNTNGKRTDLKSQASVDFTNAAGTVADRFTLIITKENSVTGTEPIYLNKGLFKIYPSFGIIKVETISNEWDGRSGSVKVLDLAGKVMSITENVIFTLNSPLSVPANLSRGIYLVDITSGIKRYTGKVVIR